MNSEQTGRAGFVSGLSAVEWTRELTAFDDATLYQSAAHGIIRSGEANLRRCVLTEGGRVVAMAQVRLASVPLISSGVAYVGWGPLWRRQGNGTSLDHLEKMLAALNAEFVEKQRRFLRVFPNVLTRDPLAESIRNLFVSQGYAPVHRADRTLVVDLRPSLEEIRSALRKKWRYDLGVAEKRGFQLEAGTSDALLDESLRLYREMHDRKGFPEFVDPSDYRRMQEILDDRLKLSIIVCRLDNEPVAAIVYSLIGDTGLALMAATGAKALGSNASYLLWWRMLVDLKERGALACDLGGVSPEHNPGGYLFKSGMAHAADADVEHLGQFERCDSLSTKVLIQVGERVRTGVRQALARVRLAAGRAQPK